MIDIPCGTRNTESNRERYIPQLKDGFALIVNPGKNLECVPASKLDILRKMIPNLVIVYE